MIRDRDQDGTMQELRRLLAVPGERDLPAGRRDQREEHLMRSWRAMERATDPATEEERTGGRKRRVRKRFVWGLAVAATVAGVAVAVPNGTQTPAYAVEKNTDGTLTVTINDLGWYGDPKHFDRLAEKIRAAGFTAIIDRIPPNRSCGGDRGEPLEQKKPGDGKKGYWYTMTHADAFVVEEHLPGPVKGSDMRAVHSFRYEFVKGPVEPCDPEGRAPSN